MGTPKDVIKTYSNNELKVLGKELLGWSETGILVNGKVREFAREYCYPLDQHYGLTIAQNTILHEILIRFVNGESSYDWDLQKV